MPQLLAKELADLNLRLNRDTVRKIFTGEIKLSYNAYEELEQELIDIVFG